jgi:hypothetical protein
MNGRRAYPPVTHVTHSQIIDVSRTRARSTPYIGKSVTCVTGEAEDPGSRSCPFIPLLEAHGKTPDRLPLLLPLMEKAWGQLVTLSLVRLASGK